MKLSYRRQVRGSVTIEAAFILPVILTMIVAASEILTILRVEQRLVNLNYNILQVVSNQRTLTRDNNIAQLPFFEQFAQQELSNIAQGQASMSIAMYNAATNEMTTVIGNSLCPVSQSWPDFELGSLVEVSLCYQPNESVSSNAIWNLWPTGRFRSHMIRETN